MNNRGNRGNRGADAIVPVDDHTSSYYLHPSDNPSLQLVSQVLIGSNSINWSRSVVTALIAKNKLQFIDGSLLRPTDDDLLSSAWIRCNSMVVSWMRNSVSPQICSSVMYLDNAHDIWSDLHDRFSQSDSARSYQLKQQLMALVQDAMAPYDGILTKKKNERQRAIDGNQIVPSPVSSSEQPFNVNAASSNFGRGRLMCSHCGRTNHTVDRCFSLHGFPQGYGSGRGKPYNKDFSNSKMVNYVEDSVTESGEKLAVNSSPQLSNLSSSDQLQQLISLLQSQLAAAPPSSPSPSPTPQLTTQPGSTYNPSQSTPFTGTTLFSPLVATSPLSSSLWLLDTGATHHVCCDITFFNASSPVSDAFVNLPNGAKAEGASLGTVIGRGSKLGNLYALDVSTANTTDSSDSSPCINSVVAIDLWHKRLGHLSFNKLKSRSDVCVDFPYATQV
ncbi:uncharacterized protein LOC121796960 [Salvia splendens]|uniref:uncharacterized protein LOC121796960 n=1 Tax=Salvia splendens TaxID=180675 RepID=UPI001C2737F2|nr:uncharacterized protein LOC121796960 [Salvia splendens]